MISPLESVNETRRRFASGIVHEPDLNAFRPFLPASPIILDVGANVGQSIVSLRLLYPDAEIHSFEANPHLHAVLDEVAAIVGGTATIHRYGLSDQPGAFELLVPKAQDALWLEEASLDPAYFELPWVRDKFVARGGLQELVRVRCELQNGESLAAAPHAIKVDVEGAEASVIRGLERVIRANLPPILVENSDWHRVTDTLGGWGFRPLRYDPLMDTLRPFEGQTTNALYVHESQFTVGANGLAKIRPIS